ncbi:MAG TPA: TonB-dependent receptor [Nevskia sp.]|nr:TonB-dependent receptor [Nevskia sp.]
MKNLAVFGLALAPALSFADAASSDTPLQPVVVTATRTPVAETDTLAQTIVIDRAEIERAQATDVADILRYHAGLEVARSGGPGQQASLFTRGSNSAHTLVLIDGVRVNNGSTGGAAFPSIDPEMIERIEVVEGPRSALWGSDAIGGVVNLITRKGGPAQFDANVGGGSFGTVRGGAGIRDSGSLDGHAWGFALGAQQERSNGIPTFAGPLPGSDDNRSFRNRTLNGSGQVELGGVHLEARAWDAEGRDRYQNETFDSNFNVNGFAPAGQDFQNQAVALEASTHLAGNWLSELTLSRGLDRVAQVEGSPDFVRTIRPEADWHNVLGLGSYNRLSFGLRAARERVDAVSSFGAPIAEAKDTDYGYVQEEFNGFRQHFVAAVNYLHDGAFGERFNWNAEYGYDLLEQTRLIAAAGTGFHAPTAEDRFGPGGNPQLQPEKSLNVELGVKQGLSAHQSVDLRLFRNAVKDLIEYVPPSFTAVNVDHSSNEGVQLDWDYNDANWTANFNGIWQDPRDTDAGAPLLRRARAIASAAVDRRFGRYDLGASFYTSTLRHDVDGITFGNTTTGGYGLLNLTAGMQITRELRFDLRGENVLNHHYQTVSAYNQPGSAVYATLRYSLPL